MVYRLKKGRKWTCPVERELEYGVCESVFANSVVRWKLFPLEMEQVRR